MSRNRQGKGDDFLEGRISEEHLEHCQHLHGAHFQGANLPITLICQPQIGAGCCWIIIATTGCTTTTPGGATCCWRFLATTDCTDTRGNAACCWQILATTDCTSTGSCDES